MTIIGIVLRITGGLCLFLYGMKVMSDGIQQAAGDRMQRFLNFMTGNRFMAVLTGFAVTAIIQSSSAATVMVVSFVNAGILTLTQSIGVIMGANIGTTVTAWIVSLVGFSLKLSELALPAVGIGFIFRIIKWKYRELGEVILGFGLLFMGLDFLTRSMPHLGETFNVIAAVSGLGFVSSLIGAGAGLLMTLLTHSSSASTAIMLTMAFNGVVPYEMAAAMILGANIGTTIDAALAAIGTKTTARRAALVHVLFNIAGVCWALPLLEPLLALVGMVTPGGAVIPGTARDPLIPAHLAMLHTVFNVANTIIFLPFIKPFAALVSFIIKEDKTETGVPRHYRLAYASGVMQNTPELNILRAEKEIRDMAGLASSMYARFTGVLRTLRETEDKRAAAAALAAELKQKEEYADEMREGLTAFLMECTRVPLNPRSEHRVSQLLRVISDLEDMTDDCYSISMLLERSVRKDHIFKGKEMNALAPYMKQVEDFLALARENLGSPSPEKLWEARELEAAIDKARNKLRKLGRKRIEAGKDVKTELLFIDLVRRIEKLGDYCYDIAATIAG
jgi:phosphate:Na+ symporter